MEILGKGGFGCVYGDGDTAVKVFEDLSAMVGEVFVTRYASMSKCPQVIALKARSFNRRTIKTQRWKRSLRDAMSTQAMSTAQRRSVFRDILLGIAHLEQLHIVHADVKASNVFVNAAADRAVLGDFGLASSSGSAKVGWTTPEYAPKRYANHRAHDAFGLAMIGVELLYSHSFTTGPYPEKSAIRAIVETVVRDAAEKQCFLGLLHLTVKKVWKASTVLRVMYGVTPSPSARYPSPIGYRLHHETWMCISHHLEQLCETHRFKRPNRCRECCESVIARVSPGNRVLITYVSALAYVFACTFGYSVKTDKKDRMTATHAAAYAQCDQQDIIAAIDTVLSCRDAVILMFTQ